MHLRIFFIYLICFTTSVTRSMDLGLTIFNLHPDITPVIIKYVNNNPGEDNFCTFSLHPQKDNWDYTESFSWSLKTFSLKSQYSYKLITMPNSLVQDYNKCNIYEACDYTRRFYERCNDGNIPKSMEFYRRWLVDQEVDPTKLRQPDLMPTALYFFEDNSYVIRYNPHAVDFETKKLFLQHCAFFHCWIKNGYATFITPPLYEPNKSEQNIIEILPQYDYTKKIEFPQAMASTSLATEQPYSQPKYNASINFNYISSQTLTSYCLLQAAREYVKNSHLYADLTLPITILSTFHKDSNNCNTYLRAHSNPKFLHTITTVRNMLIEAIKNSITPLLYLEEENIFPKTVKGYTQIEDIINSIKKTVLIKQLAEKLPLHKTLLDDFDHCTTQHNNLISMINELGIEASSHTLENLIRSHYKIVQELLQKLSIEKEMIPLPYKKEKELSPAQLENLITTHKNRLQEQINALDTYLTEETHTENVNVGQQIRHVIQYSYESFEQKAYLIYVAIQKLAHTQTVRGAQLKTPHQSCTVM